MTPPGFASPTAIAYAAGFIDGEGCIEISRRGHTWHGVRYEPMVAVSNTDFLVLEWLQTNFGGLLIGHKRAQIRPAHWRPIFVWQLFSGNAERVLRAVLPYLQVKAAVAENTIQALELKRLRCVARQRTPLDVFAQLEALHARHVELMKQRGRTRAIATPAPLLTPQLQLSLGKEG